jgi:N-acetylglucosaminyl-diphospho-decaprenol L-rhamnosyltransferase
MLPSLNIIIVNWNSAHQLSECLDSIANSDLSKFSLEKVIVVDNASIDRSLDGIEAINLPLEIIRNLDNKGFGFACNQGAAVGQADYLLFLNPDTRLFKDALDRSVSFIDDSLQEKVGVVGIQLVDEQGKVHRSCTRFPSLINFLCSIIGIDKLIKNQFTSYFMTEWDHSTTQAVDQVMGAFYMIRSDVFKLLAGFDESFFVYFEDLDLSYRVHQLGWASYYLADVQSFHKGGGTSEAVKATRLFYFIRSRILYAYKHFSWIKATTILIASLLIEPFTRTIFSIIRFSFPQVTETISAYVKLFANIQSISQLIKQQINIRSQIVLR